MAYDDDYWQHSKGVAYSGAGSVPNEASQAHVGQMHVNQAQPNQVQVNQTAQAAGQVQPSQAHVGQATGQVAAAAGQAQASQAHVNQTAPAAGMPSAPAAGTPYAPAATQLSYGVADVKPSKSHGWIVAIVIVVCLAAIILYSMNACSAALGSFGGSSSNALALSKDTVAVIDVAGTIQYDGSACSPEGLKELLDQAKDDEHIKAVVLRVDSGGGTATAGEEMAGYVRDFEKPIVVSSASINASAAYEISSQADYIYVAQSTEIGAIGTAMELADLSGLMDKLGVNMETITSAESKDSSYGYRALTDEERAYYQEMIDQINEVFIQNVADGRKMDVKAVRKLATGMPFTGVTAVKNGLADAIGTREDALDKAAELAGVKGDYDTTTLDFNAYDLMDLYDLLGYSEQNLQALKNLANAADALHLQESDKGGVYVR